MSDVPGPQASPLPRNRAASLVGALILGLVGLLAAGLVALVVLVRGGSIAQPTPPPLAPPLELTDQDGRPFSLASLAGRPVLEYLREVVADLRKGRYDDRLVYRKSLRKPPEAYTATTPPHVAAARKQAGKRGGRVAYVITTDGPEPADDQRHPLDHEHYVEKQVGAVAEPVLALLGQDFADASGSRKQLSLF